MSAHAAPRDANLALVQAMGSTKGYDPMPPDQYLCFLDYNLRLGPTAHRLLAWLRAKTIRGRPGGRTAFARDERGDLSLKHAARDLGISLPAAMNAWMELAARGLAKRDQKRSSRLFLAGQIEYDEKRPGAPSEEKANERTDNLPGYLLPYLQQLSETECEQYLQKRVALAEYGKRALADGAAAVREHLAALEKQLNSTIGAPLKEGVKQRDPERVPLVEVALRVPPDFMAVQTTTKEDGVQTTGGSVYNAENGVVQPTGSLLMSEMKTEKLASYGPEPPETPPETPPRSWTEPIRAAVDASGLAIPGQALSRQTLANVESLLAPLPEPAAASALLLFEAELRALRARRENKPRTWGIAVSVMRDAVAAVREGRVTKPAPAASTPPPEVSLEELIEEHEAWLAQLPEHPHSPQVRRELEEWRAELAKRKAAGSEPGANTRKAGGGA